MRIYGMILIKVGCVLTMTVATDLFNRIVLIQDSVFDVIPPFGHSFD